MDNEATLRAMVVAAARSWLGTPYHHHGNVRGSGVDCAMLLVEVYHAAGIIPRIDPRPYPPDWHMHRAAERYLGWVEQHAKPVQTSAPGDIVVYKFGRCMSHGGIVVDWPHIIHSYIREGCVMVRGDQGALTGRQHAFYSVFAK